MECHTDEVPAEASTAVARTPTCTPANGVHSKHDAANCSTPRLETVSLSRGYLYGFGDLERDEGVVCLPSCTTRLTNHGQSYQRMELCTALWSTHGRQHHRKPVDACIVNCKPDDNYLPFGLKHSQETAPLRTCEHACTVVDLLRAHELSSKMNLPQSS